MNLLIGLSVILVGGVIYFIPSIIAKNNYNTKFNSIFLINFFLGWTIVGWVVALMMSLEKNK